MNRYNNISISKYMYEKHGDDFYYCNNKKCYDEGECKNTFMQMEIPTTGTLII